MCWSIPSASGREKITCVMKKLFLRENDKLCLTRIEIDAKYFSRIADKSNDTEDSLTNDFGVTIHQAILSVSALEELTVKLEKWLDVPFEFYQNISGDNYQMLRINVGKNDGLITSLEKPALTFDVNLSSLRKSTVSYVVDQSCLHIFHEELKRFLAGL